MPDATTEPKKPIRRSKRLNSLPDWARKAIEGSKEPYEDAEAVQIAKRVMQDYGGERALKRLLQMFEEGEYISDIGEKFKISKQRVSQWRRALGCVTESFVVRPLVKKALTKGLI
jgi:hypothetical protein